jgi:hypothetical protein
MRSKRRRRPPAARYMREGSSFCSLFVGLQSPSGVRRIGGEQRTKTACENHLKLLPKVEQGVYSSDSITTQSVSRTLCRPTGRRQTSFHRQHNSRPGKLTGGRDPSHNNRCYDRFFVSQGPPAHWPLHSPLSTDFRYRSPRPCSADDSARRILNCIIGVAMACRGATSCSGPIAAVNSALRRLPDALPGVRQEWRIKHRDDSRPGDGKRLERALTPWKRQLKMQGREGLPPR